MTKDIGKFPGNQEQIGLDEKKSPENHGGQQTVLAGNIQERSSDQSTSVFKLTPNEGSLDQSRPMDQEKNRDVPMHLPRSQEVLPFGITNKEELEEGPTDREDLMRPTSSSIPSHENEKARATKEPPLY